MSEFCAGVAMLLYLKQIMWNENWKILFLFDLRWRVYLNKKKKQKRKKC